MRRCRGADEFGEFGHDIASAEEQDSGDADRHDDQRTAEERIDLANNLIDRQEGGNEIVKQNHSKPEGGVQRLGSQLADQRGWSEGKVGAQE